MIDCFVISLTDSLCFKPMNFSEPHFTVIISDDCFAFHLSPVTTPISIIKITPSAYSFPSGNNFNVLQIGQEFKEVTRHYLRSLFCSSK